MAIHTAAGHYDEAQHRHALVAEAVRQKIGDLIPDVIAERDGVMSELQREHLADIASFSFRCERHGDFLAVFMTRGVAKAAEWAPLTKVVKALNLSGVRGITPAFGRQPDMQGTVNFSTIPINYSSDCPVLEVNYSYQGRSYPRYAMVEEGASKTEIHHGSPMFFGGYADPAAGLHVNDCPRGAEDDRIHFSGIDVTIYAPAGLGHSVFDQILAESRRAALEA